MAPGGRADRLGRGAGRGAGRRRGRGLALAGRPLRDRVAGGDARGGRPPAGGGAAGPSRVGGARRAGRGVRLAPRLDTGGHERDPGAAARSRRAAAGLADPAAVDGGVAVLDAGRAAAGDPSALQGIVPTGGGSGTSQLAIAGGRYLFTADEAAGRVTVLALPRIEAGDLGPAVQVAAIPVDMGPAGLGVSPDGRYVYVVSRVQRPALSLGPGDRMYGLLTSAGLPRRAGTLTVIDVRRL